MEDITFVEDVVASVTTLISAGEDVQREQQSSNRKGCIARTKIVFADSSDDEGEDGVKKPATASGPTVVEVNQEYNFELDEEELVDEILTVDQQTVDSFFEDVTPMTAGARSESSAQSSAHSRTQRPTNNNEDEGSTDAARPRAARVVTDATSAVATRKRFRDDGEDSLEGDDNSEVVVEAEGVIGAKEIIRRRLPSVASSAPPVVEGEEVLAGELEDEEVPSAGTTTTVARELDGYLFTMDESDLQDYFDEEGDGEDEEEDEEDDGLDDLVIVSAVEQLVHCCTSDDQTDDEKAAYAPFLEKARAALQELSDKTLTVDEFSEKMCNDVFRLQGTLRRLSRPPKDAPIIINGVLMDM